VLGASWGELSFVAILLVIVLLSQIAPRIGEAIAARYDRAGHDEGRPPIPPAQG
jgi:hypothetical protein